MIKEILRKFGYVKLETPNAYKCYPDKLSNDIVTFTFRNGQQVIIQTDNKYLLTILKDTAEETDGDNVSIDVITNVFEILNFTLAIRNVIPK